MQWVVVTGLKKACELNGHFGTIGGSLPSRAYAFSIRGSRTLRDKRFPLQQLLPQAPRKPTNLGGIWSRCTCVATLTPTRGCRS
jgi:hypothetical protein